MVHPTGAFTNSLLGIFEEWKTILDHTSLGRNSLKPANESKDGSAPRDAIPAVGRRRKTA